MEAFDYIADRYHDRAYDGVTAWRPWMQKRRVQYFKRRSSSAPPVKVGEEVIVEPAPPPNNAGTRQLPDDDVVVARDMDREEGNRGGEEVYGTRRTKEDREAKRQSKRDRRARNDDAVSACPAINACKLALPLLALTNFFLHVGPWPQPHSVHGR